jgi:hypothetical protein
MSDDQYDCLTCKFRERCEKEYGKIGVDVEDCTPMAGMYEFCPKVMKEFKDLCCTPVSPKFPDVSIKLTEGEKGYPVTTIVRVRHELRAAGASKEEIEQFMHESVAGNYDRVLGICKKWVNIE